MIKAISYLNTLIDGLNTFTKLYELAHLETKGAGDAEKTFPAVICNGERKYIDWESHDAMIYHRLTGDISIENVPSEVDPCDIDISTTYPLKLVAFFKKGIIGQNDPYVAVKIANNIQSVITLNNDNDLMTELEVGQATVYPTGIIMNSRAVWQAEHVNVPFKGADWNDKMLISIDYNLTIINNERCLTVYDCGD